MIVVPATSDQKLATGFFLDPTQHAEAARLFWRHFHLTPPRRASMEWLQEILAGFSHLPYENLSKIIKFWQYGENETQRLRLPQEVIEDHLRSCLGGTCFSLTFSCKPSSRILAFLAMSSWLTCAPAGIFIAR
jgi:hypothetical protein